MAMANWQEVQSLREQQKAVEKIQAGEKGALSTLLAASPANLVPVLFRPAGKQDWDVGRLVQMLKSGGARLYIGGHPARIITVKPGACVVPIRITESKCKHTYFRAENHRRLREKEVAELLVAMEVHVS